MPIYETGHARNVEHFQTLISFVTGWGAAYQPSNPNIALAPFARSIPANVCVN